MLYTLKNINYLFSMDNCFVKASKSYKSLTNLPKEVLLISNLLFLKVRL